MTQELRPGLSGGKKRMWLRQHRDEILTYFELHGEAVTRERYDIKKDATWDRLLNPSNYREPKTFSKADKALARAEIAEQGLRDAKREVQELKEMYGRFVPLVADQLTERFFKPLLASKMELPPELEYHPTADPLNLADFHPESVKRGRLE